MGAMRVDAASPQRMRTRGLGTRRGTRLVQLAPLLLVLLSVPRHGERLTRREVGGMLLLVALGARLGWKLAADEVVTTWKTLGSLAVVSGAVRERDGNVG